MAHPNQAYIEVPLEEVLALIAQAEKLEAKKNEATGKADAAQADYRGTNAAYGGDDLLTKVTLVPMYDRYTAEYNAEDALAQFRRKMIIELKQHERLMPPKQASGK